MKRKIRAESTETTALYFIFPTEADRMGILLVFTCAALERVHASAVYFVFLA